MMLQLNQFYQVTERLMTATLETDDQDLKVLLATMEKEAQTLKPQIDKRLRVRN